MSTRRNVLAAALFATLALPALAQIEIKFGHVGEPGSLFAASAEEFARLANALLEEQLPLAMPIRLMGLTLGSIEHDEEEEPAEDTAQLLLL